MPSATWLSQGGAYWLMVGAWVVCAAFFAVMALQVGKAVRSENDGCLLAIGNVILAFAGGAIGFLAMMNSYPYFVLSSMAGAFVLPSIATWTFTSRARRG